MSNITQQLADNIAEVRGRIAAAAERGGRTGSDVTLVAVSKYHEAASPIMRAIVHSGCRALGESRPQQLLDKVDAYGAASLPCPIGHANADVDWHMIGHLQRNKVRKILAVTTLIHSADSPRLIGAIDRVAKEDSLPKARVLLEVNISGEESKDGFTPEQLRAFVGESITDYKNVEFQGLMCMAGLQSDPSAARHEFIKLRELRDELQPLTPENVTLTQLSMGMSRDYETAIEEGATIIRVGRTLYNGL